MLSYVDFGIRMKFLWEERQADGRDRYRILTIVAWPLLLIIGLLLRELYLQTQDPAWGWMALLCAGAFVPFTIAVAQIPMETPVKHKRKQAQLVRPRDRSSSNYSQGK